MLALARTHVFALFATFALVLAIPRSLHATVPLTNTVGCIGASIKPGKPLPILHEEGR